jgi:hypothetical protein
VSTGSGGVRIDSHWENVKGPTRLSLSSHEPEGTSLRVLADGKAVSGVDHSALKLHHSLKSPRDVVHEEIRQRERVARPGPALVHTYPGRIGTSLPALSLAILARFELDLEHPLPESERALRIVGWKLHEGNERTIHALTIAGAASGKTMTLSRRQGWPRARGRVVDSQ